MPPKQTVEAPQAQANDTQSSDGSAFQQILNELRSLRLSVDITNADVADLSMRLGNLERLPDRRLPSAYENSDQYTSQDARSRAVGPTFTGQRFLPPRATVIGEPERVPDRLAAAFPSSQLRTQPGDRDRSLPHDRSLSDRLNDRTIPDSDRAQILEEDWERSQQQDRKVDSDALWRAAYEIARREEPGLPRAELFQKAKQLANEQLLKAALDTRPHSRKTDGNERLVSLQGIQKITALSQDTYDAWINDLWSYLGSNPKARSMLFSGSSLGYDLRLDEELGGLLGLTVDPHYKATTIAKLRSQSESRGTIIFAELCKDANRDSEARKNLLRQKMRTTVQKSSEGIEDYSIRLTKVFLSLGNIDKTLTESEKVTVLLGNLNSSYSSLREAIDGGQFASGRQLSYNETISFLLTQEETRNLRSMLTPGQPLGRFNARHAAMDEISATVKENEHWSYDEDDVRAFLSQYNKYRSSRPYSGPPADHPAAATWFPGECNFCHNVGHRGAHCRMRAKMLDDAGPGPKYEVKGSARLAAGDGGAQDEMRYAQPFPGDHGAEGQVGARPVRMLSSNLE
ncbi:hypothetical protein A4X13_0g1620 [Tilletia indica]|uniref:Uncharacterized protein n=1 Tax=Tilletia indica TaxID=43049 RepID=A0A177TW04_9BASI|nr:hypothetical protein A4X13_0g1620 [Tilletia indica]